MTTKTFITLALALMLIPSSASAKKKKKIARPRKSAIEIVEMVNDKWQQTHSYKVKAFWDDAAYFTGNMEAYKLLGKPQYLEFADKWARHNDWKGAKETDKTKWQYIHYGETEQHVLFGDWQICFQTYLDLYTMAPQDYKIARAKEVMSRECEMNEVNFWWWADALYMVMPVMTKLYKATGEIKYLDKLYQNFVWADKLMWDKDQHLYYRDGRYVYPQHKTDTGKKDFWARGDGWVLAGLAKVLQDMPVLYEHRDLFVSRYKDLAEAVAQCQQPEGHWTRSMLDPEQAEGYETSGTAFFTYGLLWGINNGYLDESRYMPVVDKAWNYLTTIALQADSTVGYVQPIGDKAVKGQTLSVKSVTNFGTGAMLLAACEKARYDDKSVRPADNKKFEVEIVNNEGEQRQQLVELDAKTVFDRLSIKGGRQLIIRNARAQEIPYQLSHDGKILVDVSVLPCGKSKITIEKGVPQLYKFSTYGRFVPERKDDMAWENDKVIYRCYGPALQKSGEKAYGNDVWVKNSSALIAEKWFFDDVDTWRYIHSKGIKDQKTIDSLFSYTSFHIDHGDGMDCYAVGPSLGCGTPAIIDGDKISFPYCYKEYEILDNGPLRFTVHLKYNPFTVEGSEVVENRIVSLDKGSNFSKCTVWYEGMPAEYDVCSGVVLHTDDGRDIKTGENYVIYADPTDNAGNEHQLFVGAVFPDVSETKVVKDTSLGRGIYGHALGIKRGQQKSDCFTYYFGSSWSKADCRTFSEWELRTSEFIHSLDTPFEINMK